MKKVFDVIPSIPFIGRFIELWEWLCIDAKALKDNTIRAFAYARQGWISKDYDYGYLISDIKFKAGRLRDTLQSSEFRSNKKQVKEINKFIELLDTKPLTRPWLKKGKPSMSFQKAFEYFVKHVETWWD